MRMWELKLSEWTEWAYIRNSESNDYQDKREKIQRLTITHTFYSHIPCSAHEMSELTSCSMVATVSLRSLPVGCVCIRRVFISTKAKQPLIKASAHTTLDKLLATNMPTRNINRKKEKTTSNKFPSKCLESWARQQHNQWSLSSARRSGIKWTFMIVDDIRECTYALL